MLQSVFVSVVVVAALWPALASAEDNFKCYQAATAAGEAQLDTAPIQLTDAIESKLTEVAKRNRVCTVVDLAADTTDDPVASSVCYGIKQAAGQAKFVKRSIHVRDRFGVHVYALAKAAQLCAVSERDFAGVPAPIDELKCYKVGAAKGAAKFAATTADITDALDGTKVTNVKKPSMLCDPVDRDGLGTIDPSEHWMCYQIADAKTVPPQPKFTPVGVTVANSFDGGGVAHAMAVKKPKELCVPASAHLEGANGLSGAQFCSANRDCSSGQYCTPKGLCASAGAGAQGTACGSGAQCQENLACILYGFAGTCESAGTQDVGEACAASGDCLAGLVCSATSACAAAYDAYPDYPGVACETDSAAFGAFFEVPRPGSLPADFFRLPFPNDARVRDDGTLNLEDFPRPGPSILGVDIVDLYADALSEDFTGFSSVSNVTFRFSKEFDFDTIGANGANIHFVDVTPGTPELGTERAHGQTYASGRSVFACQHSLSVRNEAHDPLLPGHTYAVYLSSDIRSATGETPAQDADLAVLLASSAPSDVDLDRAWTQYQAFRDYLGSSGIAPATVAVATVFTVQDMLAPMQALETAVQASSLPALSDLTLCDGVVASPCDDGGVRHCGDSGGSFWEVHGRIEVPNYQQGTVPYAVPADGGDIVFDPVAGPVQQGTLDVCFALTVPKTAAPGGGWPLVVHAHGTGGSFKAAVDNGIATSAAAVGIATLTFDGVAHGERRRSSTRDEDSLVFNVINPRAARDNHLQGGVDVMQALRVAQVGPIAVGGLAMSVELDSSKVYFFGHSQGSNVGVPALAVSDHIKAAVLSGAGAYLTEGLLRKTSPVNVPAGMGFLVGETLSNGHPIMTIFQTFFDRIDPINFDPLVIRRPPAGTDAKHVLMTWGTNDTFSPESTLNVQARAMGIPVATPVIEDIGAGTVARPVSGNMITSAGTSVTAALFQYAPDGPYDGHLVALQNAQAIADWTEFLSSAAASGTPTVP